MTLEPGYRVLTGILKILVAFLYINSELSEREFKETFTIASKPKNT